MRERECERKNKNRHLWLMMTKKFGSQNLLLYHSYFPQHTHPPPPIKDTLIIIDINCLSSAHLPFFGLFQIVSITLSNHVATKEPDMPWAFRQWFCCIPSKRWKMDKAPGSCPTTLDLSMKVRIWHGAIVAIRASETESVSEVICSSLVSLQSTTIHSIYYEWCFDQVPDSSGLSRLRIKTWSAMKWPILRFLSGVKSMVIEDWQNRCFGHVPLQFLLSSKGRTTSESCSTVLQCWSRLAMFRYLRRLGFVCPVCVDVLFLHSFHSSFVI